MPLFVYKFGGTSVVDETSRGAAIHQIKQTLQAGHQLIVVVSAMGRKGAPYATDTLLSLLQPDAPARLKDMLVSTGEIISACVLTDQLLQEGIPAQVMTGWQAGIETSQEFGNAEVTSIDPSRIKAVLEQGIVPVVTGFQGVSDGQVTTLGRGGSDTSAVEIGGYLQADEVHIFTDVPGIATVDPRLSTRARFMDDILLEDMYFLAANGSGIIHPRAVATALKHQMVLRVRSTFSDGEGTLIGTVQKNSGFAGVTTQREETGWLVSFVDHGLDNDPDSTFTACAPGHYQIRIPLEERDAMIDCILDLEERPS